MITRLVRLQLVAFAVITLVGVTFVAVNYVGLGKRFVNPPYVVTLQLADTGGIFTNAEVNYRGVTIGRVGELHLTDDGLDVDLLIDRDWQVPAATRAVVANRSAVGEQYVDLQPTRTGAPYLRDGSVIAEQDTEVPLKPTELMVSLDRLIDSVDKEDLTIVIDEVSKAFAGTGTDLQRLIDSGDELTQAATDALPQTISLIEDANTVLRTQTSEATSIRTFADQLAKLTDTLRVSDPQIRKVLDDGTVASHELTDLLRKNEKTLPVLLGNLISSGQVVNARLPNVRQVLITWPMALAGSASVDHHDRTGHLSVVLSGADPPTCKLGYESTQQRVPQDIRDIPANRKARCTDPRPEVNVRGSGSVPPAGSGGQRPVAEALTGTEAPFEPFVTAYDPLTGLTAGPGGQAYTVRVHGQESRLLGDDSWQWLLLGPLSK